MTKYSKTVNFRQPYLPVCCKHLLILLYCQPSSIVCSRVPRKRLNCNSFYPPIDCKCAAVWDLRTEILSSALELRMIRLCSNVTSWKFGVRKLKCWENNILFVKTLRQILCANTALRKAIRCEEINFWAILNLMKPKAAHSVQRLGYGLDDSRFESQ